MSVYLAYRLFKSMPGAPTQLGQEKSLWDFSGKKTSGFFYTPPSALRAPSRGGSARTPGDPPLGGSPPKKGSPLPRGISRQNSRKRGRNRAKMGFFGGFSPQKCRNLHFFDKFSKVSGELCREKNALRRRLSAVQKPEIGRAHV